MQKSFIKASTLQSSGGNITITSPGYLYLIDSDISTADRSKNGNGGNISLNPEFIILDNSPIIAQADGKDGGNIEIDSTAIYQFSESPIQASGKIRIDVGDINLDNSLQALSTAFLNTDIKLKPPCYTRAENLSSFVMVPSEGTSNALDDLLPSGPLLSESLPIKTATSINN